MGGQPVWLASVSRRNPATGRLVANPTWTEGLRAQAIALLRGAVRGLGDPTRERLFRMNITYCLHRAASDAEEAGQDEIFRCQAPTGLAGGPIEILSETEPGAASTRPCAAPGKQYIDRTDRLLWLPIDCGQCEPCRARARVGETR
jgi:hypothetical protein